MSPELPTLSATSPVPSTKAWLLLLGLLTVLLLIGSRIQLPTRAIATPVLVTQPATAPLPNERRVALKSPMRQHWIRTAFSL